MMPHVCPWWGGYCIDNRLRRLLHAPEKIVGPYVKPGMTVMDVGCGMGLFSIAMAHEVPDARRLLTEIRSCLKPGGKFFVAEPWLHVPGRAFAAMVATANDVGLQVTEHAKVRWCRAVLLGKV